MKFSLKRALGVGLAGFTVVVLSGCVVLGGAGVKRVADLDEARAGNALVLEEAMA